MDRFKKAHDMRIMAGDRPQEHARKSRAGGLKVQENKRKKKKENEIVDEVYNPIIAEKRIKEFLESQRNSDKNPYDTLDGVSAD